MAIFTKDILNKGKSRNGFWSNQQIYALGLTEIKKGWKNLVLGKEISEESINKFLSLKDKHLEKHDFLNLKIEQHIIHEGSSDDELISVTEEIILLGKSLNGGWSGAQLRLLGAEPFEKGWKRKIIGSKISKSSILKFILLKDKHLNKERKNSSDRNISYDNLGHVNKDIPIEEQYKNKSWIDLRNEVLIRDKYACKICKSKYRELHVHHMEYPKGKFIWEIDKKHLVVVCKDCHEKIHDKIIE